MAKAIYGVYDVTDDCSVGLYNDFEGAREHIASSWNQEPSEQEQVQFDKIMNTQTVDELNHYAEGLGYIVEKVEQA